MPAHRRTLLSLAATLALASHPVAAAPLDAAWVGKWRADLAFMADSLPRAHPDFFHAVSREAYRAALDSLGRRLPRLEQHEVVVELARIVAMVGDGHTRVTLPFDPGAGFFTGHSTTAAPKIPGLVFRHYPIRLGLFADTLWVIRADAAHRDLLGGRVVSLGGRPIAAAIAAVEPTIQRDNDAQVRDLLPAWLVCPEILGARGVVADMERARIEVEHPAGRRVAAELAPLGPGAAVQWLDARDPGEPPLRDRFPERRHWFTTLSGVPAIYARYREVQDDAHESVARFADSLLRTAEAIRADRLVLDLRGNVGGDGSLNRPLVQGLIRAERLWRPGGLWVLTDRGTFSAAVMMAADLERWTPAVFAGEKTGGHPNSYGDSRKVVLRNSGITVRVSSLYWQLTGPQDGRDGITPLVPIEPRFADWRANRDPVLEAALARATPGTALAGEWSGRVGWRFARLSIRLDLVSQGGSWSGKVTLPAAGIDGAALSDLRVADGEVSARWTADGTPWAFAGRLAGGRLVGLVHCAGLDYAVALTRAGGR